ncbi:MAG TPA: HD domain-containing phosphohydrolase [Acidobacteriaceae bacterium]|nr:HD domain-containing phosphohydrolase [Acidobacteriaceae bacterium]
MELQSAEHAQPRAPEVEPERILVVDDEPTVLRIVTAMLTVSGYDAYSAADASQALRHLQDDPGCSMVLADVMMAGGDGLHLLDCINADYPGMPVIMLTGLDDIRTATSAFRRGAVDYLLKPFDRAQLLAAVDRALDHRQLQRRNLEYRQNLEAIVSARTSRLRAALQDLERSYDITLEALGNALDLRDTETEGHSRRVTAYTVALARAIGIESGQLNIIARGAFLHDIGKIAIPDRILLKPGKLTPGEREIMREHCLRGYEMVRKIPFLREAAEIVYAHQETFNGSGYPRGLRGEEIPLGARVFAIADTLDAITSDRPYRKGRSFAEASLEIARCSGDQFDPKIVDLFLRIPESLWIDLRSRVESSACSVLSISA